MKLVVDYELPFAGQVSLKVFNLLGEEIATIVDEVKSAGIHSITFNSSTFNLTSGIYIYKLVSGSFYSDT